MRIFLLSLCVAALSSTVVMSQSLIPIPNEIRTPIIGKIAISKLSKPKEKIDQKITNKEGYRLVINKRGAEISARSAAGLFYGRQTLAQLCLGVDSVDFVEINDAPRYGYRAMMIDPARHFQPIEDIKRFVDVMSYYKFNALHLHLSDDQGFRPDIKAYPLLTQIGANRKETEGDGTAHGGFYTQSELKDLVAYAADRFVEIIPEIDIPGHSMSAISAYPYLTCRDSSPLEVRTTPGVSLDLLCAGNERVFGMYDTIITELSAIFTSDKFHIGGDEAPLDHWTECPKCQALKEAKGFMSNQELMSYFFARINESLIKNKKRPMLWFELDVPFYPANSIMYAWRYGLSPRSIQAARQGGYQIICAPGEYAYLDYPQVKGDISAASSSWMPILPFEKVYQFDPAAGLTPENSAHILGVEATIWGEYTPTIDDVFRRAYPRALAIAEVGWSEMRNRQKDDFFRRAQAQKWYFAKKLVKYRQF